MGSIDRGDFKRLWQPSKKRHRGAGKARTWLEYQSLPIDKKNPPDKFNLAIEAWNMMGGTIDWTGLPVIAEIFGIADIELFIRQIILIRDYKSD